MTGSKKNPWERTMDEFFGLNVPILFDPADIYKEKQ